MDRTGCYIYKDACRNAKAADRDSRPFLMIFVIVHVPFANASTVTYHRHDHVELVN